MFNFLSDSTIRVKKRKREKGASRRYERLRLNVELLTEGMTLHNDSEASGAGKASEAY